MNEAWSIVVSKAVLLEVAVAVAIAALSMRPGFAKAFTRTLRSCRSPALLPVQPFIYIRQR